MLDNPAANKTAAAMMIFWIVAAKTAAESAEKPRIHAPFRELYPPPPLNNLKAANGGKNAIDGLVGCRFHFYLLIKIKH